MSNTTQNEIVLLRPRPLARCAGVLILLPLLPGPVPLRPLPAEIWSKILAFAMDSHHATNDSYVRDMSGKGEVMDTMWDACLPLVCKDFKDTALPLLYRNCTLHSIPSLRKFTTHLQSSEQKWDSLRRIPYSTPGRWVQSLDLSPIVAETRTEVYEVDTILTLLFPLVPFLARLELNLSIRLSRRAMAALAQREGTRHIRVLKGVLVDNSCPFSGRRGEEDPLTSLIECCTALEELEIIGPGLEDIDLPTSQDTPPPTPLPPMDLPHLRSLTMLSMPSSNILFRLIHSPLPRLSSLVLTPYGDVPYPISLVSEFLRKHGPSLHALILHTPKSWPTELYAAPSGLLHMLPNLRILSLENPLSSLLLLYPPLSPNYRPEQSLKTPSEYSHPLESLWIARPTAQFRRKLESLLPLFPSLREVRARDIRWVKRGVSARALEAGFQGEMRAWKRMLGSRRIKMLDADGREAEA